MTSELQQYIAEGRALDAEEREIAILELQRVDEAEREGHDAAWSAEVERRLGEILNGDVTPVAGRETLARARSSARHA